MKLWAILFFVAATVAGISSCNCAQDCTNHQYQFTLVITGYTDTDVTPMVLKLYAKGSNFSNFIDSAIYTDLAASSTQVNGATQHSILLQDNDSTDYIISLPRVGALDTITGMTFPLENCSACSKKYPVHMLANYNLNGTAVNNTNYGYLSISK
jgi:hypothetical protein